MFEFKLPDIGEGVAEAEIISWRVSVGDAVKENDVIAEVLTDKATVEISSPVSGVINSIPWKVGDIAPVGSVFAVIEEKDTKLVESELENIPTSRAPEIENQMSENIDKVESRQVKKSHHPPLQPRRPQLEVRRGDVLRQKKLAVPAVREYAKANQVDIQLVQGSGPNGRVMKSDIDEYINGSKKKAENVEVEKSPLQNDADDWERKPFRGLRRAIANRMRASKDHAAHFTYVEEIDVSEMEEQRASASNKVSPLAYFSWCLVKTISEFPQFNISLDEETSEIIVKKKIHLGVAVDTKDGLVVPVVHDALGKSILELNDSIKDLAERARDRKLKPAEVVGSTFTISSLGKWGGVMATPIINYPEVGILGVHAIRKLPRYVGYSLEPRLISNFSITLDHRLIDGAEAAKFVQRIKELVENCGWGAIK